MTSIHKHILVSVQKQRQQECIPVGCVPSAAVAMSIPACTGHCVSQHALGRGVYHSMHWAGGCITACTGQGVCIPACSGWGVSAQGGVCPRGVCLEGCLPRGSTWWGVCLAGVSAQEVSAWGVCPGVCPGVCLGEGDVCPRGVSAQGGGMYHSMH